MPTREEKNAAVDRMFAFAFGLDTGAAPAAPVAPAPSPQQLQRDRQIAGLLGFDERDFGHTPAAPGPIVAPTQTAPAPPSVDDEFATIRSTLAIEQARLTSIAARHGIDLAAPPAPAPAPRTPPAPPPVEPEARTMKERNDAHRALLQRAVERENEKRAARQRAKVARKLDKLVGR
jgi:hypothetical protein